MSWIELSLDATEEAIDWIRSLLATVNYTGELQIEKAVAPWAFHVRFYLSDRNKVNQIENVLSSLHRTGMTTELETAIVEQKASSENQSYEFGNHTILMQESLAFGSGFHPATMLSLHMIERHITPDLEVLDLGCGSGILSVAIAKLGAKVLAIDNDPLAVEATRSLVEQNAVQDLVTVELASLGKGSELGHWMGGESSEVLSIEKSFDVVIANVFARILIRLGEDLRSSVRPNGRLILSGFTIEYKAELNETFERLGFELVDRIQQGDWIALAYKREALI
jgi:ribosomal protein L11 methyltransferase